MTDALLGRRYARTAPPPALSPRQTDTRRRIEAQDTPEDWEETPCPCGAGDDILVSEVERHGLPYPKRLCRACGLMRVSPRWTQARYGRFYAHEYRDLYASRGDLNVEAYVRKLAGQPNAQGVARFVASACADLLPGVERPTVVEIGAGGGWNLAGLPASWTRIGFDADDDYLKAGASAFGVAMRNGFWEEALPTVAEADITLLSHVVEHVPDPVATLWALGRTVRPGALIVVEVPGIFRIHSTVRDPMRYMQNAHTFTFCAETFTAVCEAAGLEVVRVDEFCRAVLRAGLAPQDAPRPTRHIAGLARDVLRYLRWCDAGRGLSQGVGNVLRMTRAASVVEFCWDAFTRILLRLGVFGRHVRSR
ncbi:MAG: class I SAM-dependent methyltransferase [Caulobacter sp.]|nr:class I SAM-dependent methyltransferase [Caulobacter sp.]